MLLKNNIPSQKGYRLVPKAPFEKFKGQPAKIRGPEIVPLRGPFWLIGGFSLLDTKCLYP